AGQDPRFNKQSADTSEADSVFRQELRDSPPEELAPEPPLSSPFEVSSPAAFSKLPAEETRPQTQDEFLPKAPLSPFEKKAVPPELEAPSLPPVTASPVSPEGFSPGRYF